MADVDVHGLKLSSLPTQDNHCDCGLFVLCFVMFFCHANPRELDFGVLEALNNAKGETRGGGMSVHAVGHQSQNRVGMFVNPREGPKSV